MVPKILLLVPIFFGQKYTVCRANGAEGAEEGEGSGLIWLPVYFVKNIGFNGYKMEIEFSGSTQSPSAGLSPTFWPFYLLFEKLPSFES